MQSFFIYIYLFSYQTSYFCLNQMDKEIQFSEIVTFTLRYLRYKTHVQIIIKTLAWWHSIGFQYINQYWKITKSTKQQLVILLNNELISRISLELPIFSKRVTQPKKLFLLIREPYVIQFFTASYSNHFCDVWQVVRSSLSEEGKFFKMAEQKISVAVRRNNSNILLSFTHFNEYRCGTMVLFQAHDISVYGRWGFPFYSLSLFVSSL